MHTDRKPRRKRHGFTLVELLVVIAIIAVLIGLLLPAVQAAREAARRASCLSKIKQLGLAVQGYHDSRNRFPVGAESDVWPVPQAGTTTIAGTSWIVHILPLIEEQTLFDRYDFSVAHNHANNAPVGNTVLPSIYCPSGPDPLRYRDPNGGGVSNNPSTHYYGVMGPAGLTNPTTNTLGGQTFNYTVGDANVNGAWSAHGILSHFRVTAGSVSTNRFVQMRDVTDGTSLTLLVAERAVVLPGTLNDYRSWIRGNFGGSGATKNVTYPINSTNYNGSTNFNHISFGSQHPGGCLFVMADASARFVSETIAMPIYMAMASINSGEQARLP